MGAHSRRKGAQAERDVANIARALGFLSALRNAPMQAGYSDDFPDVSGVGPLWIEVKREHRCALAAHVREYVAKERAGFVPTLCWREDGGEWVASLPMSELFKLVRKAYPDGG